MVFFAITFTAELLSFVAPTSIIAYRSGTKLTTPQFSPIVPYTGYHKCVVRTVLSPVGSEKAISIADSEGFVKPPSGRRPVFGIFRSQTQKPPGKGVVFRGEKNSIVDLVRKKASKTVAASHICIGRIIFVDLKVD